MRRGRESTSFAWGRGLLAVPLALVLFALAAPASAGAATICVGIASPSCESTTSDIQSALNQAAGSPADDRVVIGPGRFNGDFVYLGPGGSGHIEVVGQGPGTVLTAPSGSTAIAVLQVVGDPQGDGSLVSNLTVRVPSNSNATGNVGIASGAVSNVRVASDANGPSGVEAVGVELVEPGGYLRNSVVEMVDGSEYDYGVKVQGGSRNGPTTIGDSRILAPTGVFASNQATSVVRSRITGERSGVLACNSAVTVEDSLLRVVGAGTGLVAEGRNQCSPEQGSIVARQVTIVGGGPLTNSTGAAAYSGNSGQNPRIDVVLSIVRGVTAAFRAVGISPGSSATITAGASDFEAARVSEAAIGGTASFSEPEPDIDADPLFVSDLLGEFGLRAGSPAIDSAYSPPLAADESTTDLAGNPRVLDGNGDGVAARDMGAYEAAAVPVPPDTTPPDTHIVKPKKVLRKKKKLVAGPHGYPLKVAFTSSEPNSHFECRLDAGRFATCSSPYRKHLAAGLHRFEVRAVDAAGNADPTPARENFRIAKAPVKHRH